tara:strand:- start:38 stop:190 length:153 start_codon:yes stop_codon:yes gene_type:complete
MNQKKTDKFGRTWELVTLPETQFIIKDLLMRLCFVIPISGALFWIAIHLP